MLVRMRGSLFSDMILYFNGFARHYPHCSMSFPLLNDCWRQPVVVRAELRSFFVPSQVNCLSNCRDPPNFARSIAFLMSQLIVAFVAHIGGFALVPFHVGALLSHSAEQSFGSFADIHGGAAF